MGIAGEALFLRPRNPVFEPGSPRVLRRAREPWKRFSGVDSLPASRRADMKSSQRRRFWELPAVPALRLFTTSAKVVMYGQVGSPGYKQITTGEAAKSFEIWALYHPLIADPVLEPYANHPTLAQHRSAQFLDHTVSQKKAPV